jgi:hypothetical protein
MRTGSRRGTAAVLAAVALVASVLSGCSLLRTPPPEGAVTSVAALRERLAAVDGVGDVETSLYQSDYRRSGTWTASVDVTADTSDLAVAAAVRDARGDGVTHAVLVLSLEVLGGSGMADVTLDPEDPEVVGVADGWRRIPGAATVHLGSEDRRVVLRAGTTVSEAADRFRTILGDGHVTLQDDTLSVGVTATEPGPALLSAIDGLAGRRDVSSLSSSPGQRMERGEVRVEADDVARAAAVLAATFDEAADAGSRPRTAFTVRTPYAPDRSSDDEREIQGWVGLPLGSPEPADLPQPEVPEVPVDPPRPEAPPALVDVAAQEAGVRAFLEAAVTSAGVPAEVTSEAMTCADGSAATQAAGHVLIPVFTVMDDAQVPFDAITRSWTDAGFARSDRAMGRDYWSAGEGRADGVISASIRGTADGLSISAESVCVR